MTRTTLRIQDDLKRAAQRRALEEDTTLQDVFNRALNQYLQTAAKSDAKKIVFITHDLGEPLDNLRRSDYYPEPDINTK
jgi:ABC-type proline/glycine betaine transport system ATPase subunit